MLSHGGMRPPCMHGSDVDHPMLSSLVNIRVAVSIKPQLYGSTYVQIIRMCMNMLFLTTYMRITIRQIFRQRVIAGATITITPPCVEPVVLYKRGRLLDDRVDKTYVQHIICTYLGLTILFVCDDDDCRIS